MAIVGGLALAIYYAPIPCMRTFPITFDGSGDIVYPEWAYPYRGWLLPAHQAGTLSLGGPMLVYLVAGALRLHSLWDASNAVLGTAWAGLLGALAQVVLKQLVGGFRPYFLSVCMPDPSLGRANNRTGLNGVGFQRVMYSTDVCTQPDPWLLKTAATAFPSGHATAAFAGLGFLFLWTHAKLKVWADHRPAFWKLALTLLPLLVAATVACALTVDAAHNWYDIAAGAAIGVGAALASYRASYAAVWDWRYNHIPLLPGQPFAYDGDGEADHVAATLAQTAGWGASSRKKRWLPEEEPEGASSGTGAVGRRAFDWQDAEDA
ncbi:phosphatidic acid phosphatase beta [Cordyceps fumosorosea ARSEF 2679]|uniref:Phosphatidic acid phosphatase beta n=1 Tax=Cordyceps fumosorosea (strain ARSEF 2679) TaxID=1081104 RepID=A0A162MW54_CORFA|nr:phosphatidic acid phosphatase beta [Cordyceps fumosorosea ARSEF 2679]OAA71529.1 phosphatidic acid phosphatase beta [Cordyceps fumosorosea ARSEF 2679]